MKGILLAAGRGERLRPLTDRIPKVLLPLAGRPLLDYWVEACARAGIDELLINGCWLAEQIASFVTSASRKWSVNIHFMHERDLMGTGGTLLLNWDFVASEETFFFCHADNFSDIDLCAFRDFHQAKGSPLSVALFKTTTPHQCGIAEELDEEDRICCFVEKPTYPNGDLASAAMFMASPEIYTAFPEGPVVDFSKEVLPAFQSRMHGFRIDGFNLDIGTHANYRNADQLAKELEYVK